MATHLPVTENTLIVIKIAVHDCTKKLKLPLKDLGADKLIPKLRHLLLIKPSQDVVFERYSDSVGGYVVLDPASPAVFKTLVRAAKAKLKLRLRATITPPPGPPEFKDVLKEKLIDMSEPPTVTGAGPTAFAPAAAAPAVSSVRGSTAFDQRSVGPGIFKFRDSPFSNEPAQTRGTDEAPVPRPFNAAASKDFFAELATNGIEHELALRSKDSTPRASAWSVYCNECDCPMDNVHFHCSVCDGGDYDLCQSCVDKGKLCPGEGHWLIRRSIDDGKIVASTTERVAPKARVEPASIEEAVSVEVEKIEDVSTEREIPGAFTDDARTLNTEFQITFRTCNNCVAVFADDQLVTCAQCDDFDLCRQCHIGGKHGHHPAHCFAPAVPTAKLSLVEESLLPAGRNVRHSAICDGCDQNIRGVRHKCFSCPDFDYCNDCIKDARHTHPRHRFAPIYEPLSPARGTTSTTHHGIYCDGALCKDKPFQSYIQGVRYKCVVCHDTDFCASCEALPANSHNKTHPLIKFKTPVNNVTISTENEDKNGRVRCMGDKHAAAVTSSKPMANVTTPVKTVADIEPSQKAAEDAKVEEKTPSPFAAVLPIRNLQDSSKSTQNVALEAHFVRDTVADGTTMAPATRFTQTWTLCNAGPRAWPAGCSVRFVGGDNMLSCEPFPSASDLNEATESNVVGREVQPGEEVAFKVLLETPLREGKSISYWRIKTPDGIPFGHKLWCDIEVKKSEAATAVEPVSSATPNASQDSQPSTEHAHMAKYWAGYQQRMAKIRLENAQRQAALNRQVQAAAAAATSQAHMDWRRQMEDFVRRTNVPDTAQRSASDDGSKADMTVKAEPMSGQSTPEMVVEERKESEDGGELTDSQMIFPTLCRESASSSTMGKVASVEDDDTEAEAVKTTSTPVPSEAASKQSDEETFEDISELEILSADDGDESSEDGFMTDEEYDILDASDQETVASK